jgi:L-asparagine oxygenase
MTDPLVYDLPASDAADLWRVAAGLRDRYPSTADPDLALDAPVLLREIPAGLTRVVREFHRAEPAGAMLIRGIALDDGAVGPTPDRYDPPRPTTAAETLDFCLVLLAHLLGEPFGWSNLQGGRLVHNVLPVPGRELEKTGSSSRSTLELHTEDACHPARADYLMLLSVRNDDRVPTVYAPFDGATVDRSAAETLVRERFDLRSEPEHVASLGESRVTSVLFGDPATPYLSYDGYYLTARTGDEEAARALRHLTERLEGAAQDVVLEPGDLLILDNYRAVHGRRPFQARYDGRDRWLKRVHVTRDLRRSRAWRASARSAIVAVDRFGFRTA